MTKIIKKQLAVREAFCDWLEATDQREKNTLYRDYIEPYTRHLMWIIFKKSTVPDKTIFWDILQNFNIKLIEKIDMKKLEEIEHFKGYLSMMAFNELRLYLRKENIYQKHVAMAQKAFDEFRKQWTSPALVEKFIDSEKFDEMFYSKGSLHEI